VCLVVAFKSTLRDRLTRSRSPRTLTCRSAARQTMASPSADTATDRSIPARTPSSSERTLRGTSRRVPSRRVSSRTSRAES